MGWDAHLYTELDGKEITVGDYGWNYTHNTNGMIAEAIRTIGLGESPSWWLNDLRKEKGDYWCGILNGMLGSDGAKFLSAIITELESNKGKYDQMNPSNGWGSRERVVVVLDQMRRAGEEWPSAKFHIC